MKYICIGDFLTDDEIQQVLDIVKAGYHRPVQVICDKITKPNSERINKALGQENDPKFLAYMIEYAIRQSGVK